MGEVMLGLDVGDARIGVAVGEVGHAFVFGRGAIPAKDEDAAVRAVLELARSEGAERVVVGLPRRTGGGESRQAQRVRAFAAKLADAGLKVVFEDERFTSQLAQRQVRAAGLPRGKRQQKGRVDEAAARLILESYLAKAQRTRAAEGPVHDAERSEDDAERLDDISQRDGAVREDLP